MSWITAIVEWFVRRDPLARAGELAAAEAERLFALDVYDPSRLDKSERAERSRDAINEIIKAAGWTWEVPYLGNGQVEWCGMFAATCWRAAGLDPKWPATFWASTLRLSHWARYRDWNGHDAGTRPSSGGRMLLKVDRATRLTDVRFPDGTQPRAGDVVIVGDGRPPEGDHITVLVSYDSATGRFLTISGNGGGFGPDGKQREGIVKRTFVAHATSGYAVLWVLRPGRSDLLPVSELPAARARS